MKRIVGFLALVVLAGCGADGEPVQPQAAVNIGVGSSGVHTSVGVGARKGPVSVFVGF